MDCLFHDIIAKELNISSKSVKATMQLLDEGATVPFISRYRKEVTGELDEVAVRDIQLRYEKLKEISRRKEYVLEVISQQNALTPELRTKIENTFDSVALEDLFLPYKPKRRTRAAAAREKGLEPLAKIIMSQNVDNIDSVAQRYVKGDVDDIETAISGALDIIAEWISESESARSVVRNVFERSAIISSQIAKGKEADAENYLNYKDFSQPLRNCSSYRYLAMRRGEEEGLLKVLISIEDELAINRINKIFVKRHATSDIAELLQKAVKDSYKRLIRPSIETDVSANAKSKADERAINTFSENLRQLLMAPPLGRKRVMGIDPGYRTGCKVVCLDEQGNLLHNDVIYPCQPKNDIKGASRKVSYLVEAYKIDAIAVGNGTASRETERFLTNMRFPHKVQVFVVNESGASIYSASKVAREEFPDKDVTVRGAVSIGRRLIDPLAELVKIEPKSIGVGQYQHDVDQTKLKEALDYTVSSCVNLVGVNVNTASTQLLSYVSGIGSLLATNIVKYRSENGDFKSREQLLNVPRMGAKSYQQCAGFLRIPNANNILDNTSVHPESYAVITRIADDIGCSVEQLIAQKEMHSKIDLMKYVDSNVGLPTLKDIMHELEKPGRDPRSSIKVFSFDESLKTIDDVKPGMIVNGIVNNITDFGVFVDIGVKESGLVHVSQLCDKFVSSPTDIVSIHQHVKVKVLDVDLSRRRISLTMKNVE